MPKKPVKKTASPRKVGKPAAAKKKAAPKARKSRMGAPDPATGQLLDELLGTHPELRRGVMFGCPAYFLGKKAVACVFESDVCVTLPVPEIEALVARPGFRKFAPMAGRVMSGWMLVDRARLAELTGDRTLLEHAIEYARSKAAAPAKGKPAISARAGR